MHCRCDPPHAPTSKCFSRCPLSRRFIARHFRPIPSFKLRHLLPEQYTLAVCAACFAVTSASARGFADEAAAVQGSPSSREFLINAVPHVAVGVGMLAVLGAVIYKVEKPALREALALRRGMVDAGSSADRQQGSAAAADVGQMQGEVGDVAAEVPGSKQALQRRTKTKLQGGAGDR